MPQCGKSGSPANNRGTSFCIFLLKNLLDCKKDINFAFGTPTGA